MSLILIPKTIRLLIFSLKTLQTASDLFLIEFTVSCPIIIIEELVVRGLRSSSVEFTLLFELTFPDHLSKLTALLGFEKTVSDLKGSVDSFRCSENQIKPVYCVHKVQSKTIRTLSVNV